MSNNITQSNSRNKQDKHNNLNTSTNNKVYIISKSSDNNHSYTKLEGLVISFENSMKLKDFTIVVEPIINHLISYTDIYYSKLSLNTDVIVSQRDNESFFKLINLCQEAVDNSQKFSYSLKELFIQYSCFNKGIWSEKCFGFLDYLIDLNNKVPSFKESLIASITLHIKQKFISIELSYFPLIVKSLIKFIKKDESYLTLIELIYLNLSANLYKKIQIDKQMKAIFNVPDTSSKSDNNLTNQTNNQIYLCLIEYFILCFDNYIYDFLYQKGIIKIEYFNKFIEFFIRLSMLLCFDIHQILNNKYFLIFFKLLGTLLILILEKVDVNQVSNNFSPTDNTLPTNSGKEQIVYSRVLLNSIDFHFSNNFNLKEVKTILSLVDINNKTALSLNSNSPIYSNFLFDCIMHFKTNCLSLGINEALLIITKIYINLILISDNILIDSKVDQLVSCLDNILSVCFYSDKRNDYSDKYYKIDAINDSLNEGTLLFKSIR